MTHLNPKPDITTPQAFQFVSCNHIRIWPLNNFSHGGIIDNDNGSGSGNAPLHSALSTQYSVSRSVSRVAQMLSSS